VLQDGLPIVGARGITEGAIDLNQQEVGRLERVEVWQGAASRSTAAMPSAASST